MSKHLNKSNFPYILKSAREAAGFSQELTAKISCIPLKSIIKFELGSKTPSLQEAIALAKTLGVSVESLFWEPVSRSDGVFFDVKFGIERLLGKKFP